MKDRQLVGLLKFFRDQDKLDALKKGVFWCNTPEFYRLSGDEGVSDLHESCSHAYRESRDDEPIKLLVNGKELEGLTAVTVHTGGLRDKWLHCWFALHVPASDAELEALTLDINRMRKEFGEKYAFLPAMHIKTLAERISAVTDHDIDHGHVRYSDHRMEWSAACKASSYSYQREYRFVVGNCPHICIDPEVVAYAEGLSDLIGDNEFLQIKENEPEKILFHLGPSECYWSGSS